MKNYSQQSKPRRLATKLSIYLLIVLTFIFSILILLIWNNIRNDLINREEDKLAMLAIENANIAREFMENMVFKQEVLVDVVKNLENVDSVLKIDILKKIIADTKKSEENILSLFVILEPDIIATDTPDGYSIFATDNGTTEQYEMFENVKEESYNKVKQSKKIINCRSF